MKIDWTINLGNLIPVVTLLTILVSKMIRMETKVEMMWNYLTKTNGDGPLFFHKRKHGDE